MTPRISNDTEWYQKLLDLIRLRFAAASKPLFTTNANSAMNGSFGLFPVYLTSLPESERQHHTCAACRRFVESFGDLVEISEDGKTRSALWDLPDVPEPYTRPIQLMNEIVCHAKVTGVFVSSEKVYGNPITGQWTHFSATPEPSEVYASATKTASQLSAEKAQDYLTVLTAADHDSPPVIQWDVPGARNPLSWYVYHGGSAPSEWSLAYGSFTEVNAITLQPSMWNGGNEHQGAAVFFILEGAHDSRAKTCGLGLFPEFLKSELHGIRATIEAFSRNGVIEGAESASACGLRIQKGIPANAEFRVTTDNGIINYTIDRWD